MGRLRVGWRTIVWIFLIGLAVIWAYKYTQLIQAFEDQSADEEKKIQEELTTAMTSVSEMMCPMQKEVIQKLMEDEVSEEENNKGGIENVSQQRRQELQSIATRKLALESVGISSEKAMLVPPNFKGLVFPCPPPSNPQEIPVNIKDYMLGTARGCAPTVAKIKEDVAKARECPKMEKFTATIPVYINHTTKEAYEDIAKIQEEIMKKTRIVALQAKLRGIKEAMMDPLYQQTVLDYKEVKRLKDEAEKGTLTPNCAT
jgi:hypothetical protein